MSIGKLTNDELNQFVLDEIKAVRKDVLLRPGIGEDCGAFEVGDFACVVTTDPITGATEELGKLAVHISVNDIASSGAEPVGIVLTLLCPVGTHKEQIKQIMLDASREANAMNIEILGGHTELTDAVNRIVVSVTAFGKVKKEKLISTGGAQSEDYIYMTKSAGIEGSAIIAKEKKDALKDVLSKAELLEAAGYIHEISVLKEGLIGGDQGVSSMHDVTEGGVLGALYELCEASGVGCKVHHEKIHVREVTNKICNHFNINPLKLISSGSMLITMNKRKAAAFETELHKKAISYSKIGVITENREKILYYGMDTDTEVFDLIESPVSDELYKVI